MWGYFRRPDVTRRWRCHQHPELHILGKISVYLMFQKAPSQLLWKSLVESIRATFFVHGRSKMKGLWLERRFCVLRFQGQHGGAEAIFTHAHVLCWGLNVSEALTGCFNAIDRLWGSFRVHEQCCTIMVTPAGVFPLFKPMLLTEMVKLIFIDGTYFFTLTASSRGRYIIKHTFLFWDSHTTILGAFSILSDCIWCSITGKHTRVQQMFLPS